MENINTLIIGAGPAGLAVGGRLRKRGLDFEIIEKSDKIAYSWHHHYDRLCLHTVKQLSHLPHLPFPEDYDLYVPREDVVKYCEQYARHFDIHPHFNTEVRHIEKTTEDTWKVTTGNKKVFTARHVVVATGVNRVPHSPVWRGQKDFEGRIIHSRNYKNALPFKDQSVLIIGMGNTGAEIALDLAENDVETFISVRSPISIVPRDVFGRPAQLTAKKLARIPFGLGDWLGGQIRKVIFGNLSKYGLPVSKMHPAVQLRKTGKTPVVDLGTTELIKQGKIKVVPDVEYFSKDGVILDNGKPLKVDAVILCTGYRARLQDFLPGSEELMNKDNIPKQTVAEGAFKGLYFVGFDNYKLGGILGTIYTDSETVVNAIEKIEQQVIA